MKIENYKKFSPLVLRTALAVVFLWFGFSQLSNPAGWTRMVPGYASSMISANTLIYLHGIFEIVCAILLLLGLYTRVASGLLTLNLLHITTLVGYGPTGARDFALTLAALAIFLHGTDEFCLDALRKKKEHSEHKKQEEN